MTMNDYDGRYCEGYILAVAKFAQKVGKWNENYDKKIPFDAVDEIAKEMLLELDEEFKEQTDVESNSNRE